MAPPPSTTPSSSSDQPQPTRTIPTDQYNNKNPLIHYTALGVTPLAILGLFLPPRRLDFRALMLGGVALWGTNQLAHDYSGKSFGERFSSRLSYLSDGGLPEKAKETRERLREEKEHRAKLRALRDEMIRSGAAEAKGPGLEGWTEEQKKALLVAYQKQRKEEEAKAREEKSILDKIWMGDASSDWKEKRDQKEREALKEGGAGYLGLITDQISEVFSGKKADQGDASKKETGEDDENR
ncbi:hypothetical protein GGS21DRAFT_518828 [Xylaria nigripes]|nr:hypothetical protein GGS21DRAFT_518828 [Xylaria nigripes]